MKGLTDIHCHIIPYVDDGALRMQEAEELLRMQIDQGVTTVCCTPHLRKNMFETPDDVIQMQFERLKAWCIQAELPVTLYLSREYHCDELLIKKLEAGQILPLGKGKTLLAELSHRHSEKQIHEYIRIIKSYGFTPLLAHAERYEALESTASIARLTELGALIQMNAGSLTGAEGRRQASRCKKLLKEHLIHVIASDAHDPEERPPELAACASILERKFGEEYAAKLLCTNPYQILEDPNGGTDHANG